MAEQRVTRKLAAIFYADVAGYSRLTGEDEEGTHHTLSSYLDAITGVIEGHGGRVLHYAGDAILAEFASVVVAVTCAAEVQRDLGDRNKDLPEDRKVQFRIGVNLGDVIVDRGEIYGDGVNVAARLESLAEPGGICVSGAAHEQVRDKLSYHFKDRGELTVKNIARPIHVYQLTTDGAAVAPLNQNRISKPRLIQIVAGATIIIAVGLGGWFALPTFTSMGVEQPPSLGKRLSIAVLPFTNLSGDKDQNFFADAVTEDLTADLSRISGSFVISRRTAATYRGKNIDPKRIASELKVSYLLEGTVRRARANVRVSVQLTDGQTGQQVWSERYEKSAGDMYAFQNEVTGRVARAPQFGTQGHAKSPGRAGQRWGSQCQRSCATSMGGTLE